MVLLGGTLARVAFAQQFVVKRRTPRAVCVCFGTETWYVIINICFELYSDVTHHNWQFVASFFGLKTTLKIRCGIGYTQLIPTASYFWLRIAG
jgi:hypothetical protein